ncbi:hypothetical protein GUITHDRAFT_110707 [Guillardia theta CCMP2712]|uniref:Uncharacterized protein n=1 Tax=Guillardia theta (strain CCMP2712) TaxID=905079 RepID=L1J4R5_GUITC|nr:hypothetical protein GUITHDRAFT_110707 [Guillardia theta CCMP2712]EKX43292.1 hypothetical protein GUITHDRAFT_110707 [Guillardia theta CCMP2712]|eukprot:XP_005830272.1 hypothetical protein GUITHDRAFT_110707 [Guillardia theta CCMP2712]
MAVQESLVRAGDLVIIMAAETLPQPWEIVFLVVFWGSFTWYMSQWDGELVNKTFFWQFVSLFFWCYNHLGTPLVEFGAHVCGDLRLLPAASFFGLLMAIGGLYTAGGQLMGGMGSSKKRR